MKIILPFLLVLGCNWSNAQTTLIGSVTNKSGEPIPGANVVIEGTYDGSSTQANGSFTFTTNESEERVLTVTCIGFKTYTTPIELSGESIRIHVILNEEINELESVTISAGTYSASDESRRTIFTARDIASTAGATADIAGALNTLPGTQKVGETGRLFVRGGDGDETRTFIDGMLVLDAYNASAPNTPSRGRFLPFMFKGSSFSTGGYSAEYGQALSSALVLDSRDVAEGTRTDFGLLSVGADITHTHVWDKASVAGKIQYTNIRPYVNLIDQEQDWISPPTSQEASATFRHQVGKNGMFKVFGNISHTNFALNQHSIDNYADTWLYEITNDYRYINASFKNQIGEHWMLRSGISYSDIRNNVSNVLKTISSDRGLHVKSVVGGSLNDHIEMRAGLEVLSRRYEERLIDHAEVSRMFVEPITATFAEVDVYLSNHFVARTGARLEYNSLLDHLSVEPRTSLAYRLHEQGTISLAYGNFNQSAKTRFLKLDQSTEPEKASHYIVSYQHIKNRRTFRVEAYYKDYEDLIKYSGNEKVTLSNEGSGYAKGFELFWRDNQSLKNTDYWISYSYLDTKRDYLDFPHRAIPTFASAHNFSAVYKYFFSKLKTQFGATYSFTSGRPYNDPNDQSFNAGMTPAYHDLSINFAYLPTPQLIIYASVTNVLGHENIFGYEYSSIQNENGLYNRRPITQPAPRFIFLGVFLTLSRDKSINQLPTL